MDKSKLFYTFDQVSQVWLEPFSVILNCMLPIEYIYAEWFKYDVHNEVLRSDPEYIGSRDVREIETGSQVEGFCIPEFRVSTNTDHFPRFENRELAFYTLVMPDIAQTEHWIPDHDSMKFFEGVADNEQNQPVRIFNEVVHSIDDPRYLKLRITDDWKKFRPVFKDSTFLHHSILFPEKYGGHEKMLNKLNSSDENVSWAYDAHGPVRKLESMGGWIKFEEDKTQVFKFPQAWPEPAMEWLVRPRSSSWPSPDLIQKIFESGCHIAPVGRGKREQEPPTLLEYLKDTTKSRSNVCPDSLANNETVNYLGKAIEENGDTALPGRSADPPAMDSSRRNVDPPAMDETEWRLSFSVAENILAQSVSPAQRHIMILLKMIKKFYLSDVGITTYLLKNLMFWEIEKQDETFWCEENSAKCLLHMLDRLQKSLEEGFLPQYLMPKSNLLHDEDPKKLANAVDLICEVRKTILPKSISMLKRCCSLAFQSATFHRRLYFEPFLGKLQDGTLSDGDVMEMVCSLQDLFPSRCQDCIESMLRIIPRSDATEENKRSSRVTINVYISLLARCLIKLWFLTHPDSSTQEEFTSFVSQHESASFSPNDDLIQLALVFFQQASEGKELSDLVPNTTAMKNIKEMYSSNEKVSLAQGNDCVGFIKSGDLLEAMKVMIGGMKDASIQDVKMEELEAQMNNLLLLSALRKERE